MKKYRDILAMAIVLTTSLLATDSFLLPEIVKQDANFKPFAERAFDLSQQNIVNRGVIPGVTHEIINNTQCFLKIDFDTCLSKFHDAFGFIWTPQREKFDNEKLEVLFKNYHTKTTEHEKPLIFSANLLYVAGMEMFKDREIYTHLEQAAIVGHHRAQFEMFKIKYKESDYQQAMNYLLSSAAQKNPDSLVTLSDIYFGFWSITTCSRDNSMAKLLCEEAAKQNEEAMFTLRVATKTEGFFGEPKNFQDGIMEAKKLAEIGNKTADDFLSSLRRSSGESLSEMFDLAEEDLQFLRGYIQWKDEDE